MKKVLTAKTQALMGVKTEPSDEGMVDFFNNTIDYLVGSLSGGVNISQIEPDGLNAVRKILSMHEHYEPYNQMSEFKTATQAVENAIKSLEEAKSALWDAATKLGIKVG